MMNDDVIRHHNIVAMIMQAPYPQRRLEQKDFKMPVDIGGRLGLMKPAQPAFSIHY